MVATEHLQRETPISTLIVTRGLPSSGKTTYAKRFIKDNPDYVRVNRDSMRSMLLDHSKQDGMIPFPMEQAITHAQNALVTSLIESGKNVICDDTNIRPKYVRNWAKLAQKLQADFKVIEITCSIDEAISRNTARRDAGEEYVDDAVIHNMAKYLAKNGEFKPWEPLDDKFDPLVPYEPPEDAEKAVLVDIDGTSALMQDRSPFDWHRVGEDLPNTNIINTFMALSKDQKARVIFISGRDAVCYAETSQWIVNNISDTLHFDLYMRPAGDNRKDAEVKLEIFNNHVRDNYNVIAVFDDRDSVVRLWRDLGLTTMQVNYGDF